MFSLTFYKYYVTSVWMTMAQNNEIEEIRSAFRRFDKYGNSLIRTSELIEVLSSFNDTDNKVRDMIRDVDIDPDGFVNYQGD